MRMFLPTHADHGGGNLFSVFRQSAYISSRVNLHLATCIPLSDLSRKLRCIIAPAGDIPVRVVAHFWDRYLKKRPLFGVPCRFLARYRNPRASSNLPSNTQPAKDSDEPERVVLYSVPMRYSALQAPLLMYAADAVGIILIPITA